jgi:hypothetical protein
MWKRKIERWSRQESIQMNGLGNARESLISWSQERWMWKNGDLIWTRQRSLQRQSREIFLRSNPGLKRYLMKSQEPLRKSKRKKRCWIRVSLGWQETINQPLPRWKPFKTTTTRWRLTLKKWKQVTLK